MLFLICISSLTDLSAQTPTPAASATSAPTPTPPSTEYIGRQRQLFEERLDHFWRAEIRRERIVENFDSIDFSAFNWGEAFFEYAVKFFSSRRNDAGNKDVRGSEIPIDEHRLPRLSTIRPLADWIAVLRTRLTWLNEDIFHSPLEEQALHSTFKKMALELAQAGPAAANVKAQFLALIRPFYQNARLGEAPRRSNEDIGPQFFLELGVILGDIEAITKTQELIAQGQEHLRARSAVPRFSWENLSRSLENFFTSEDHQIRRNVERLQRNMLESTQRR